MDKVAQLYKDSGYPAAERLYQIVKKEGISGVTKADVVKFLADQTTASLHTRAPNPKRNAIPITTSDASRDFQMDLLDFQSVKNKGNKGMAWAFIIEDVFNRKAYIEPIKTKSPSEVLPALKNAFEKLGVPMRITADDGSEWKGAVGEFLESKLISLDAKAHLHTRMGIIDSFARFVKNSLGKHFTATQSTNWIDYIPTLLAAYHRTPHSGLPKGMTPDEATDPVKATEVRDAAYEKVVAAEKGRKVSNIIVGSHVRVIKRKELFDRGYQVRWSIPIYTVDEIDSDGTWYTLSNGKKYRLHQLQEVKAPKTKAASDLEERKEPEIKDVQRKARFDAKTENILKFKEGVSESNRREGLRERAPSSQLVHSKYGTVRW
jgi:hypothetical protein